MDTATRTVLVTGGSGFLGVNLCRALLMHGHHVRTLDLAPFDYLERGLIDEITGDIRDPATVERAMQGVDWVVHCAAALPLADPDEIHSTNVGGIQLLLDAALRHGVQRFINISSTAVYGIPDHHPIAEDDACRGVGPYGQSKVDAEMLCCDYRVRGLCVSNLRPKSFVGPERLGVFELLYSWAYEGRNFPVLDKGDNLYQLLDVADLCDAIELCATGDPALVNATFNVAASSFGTMRENFQAVLDRAGHGKRVVSLPRGPAIAALKLLERLHLSPLYRWIYETAAEESSVSIERIRSRLGFRPRYSNRQALIRSYDWYVAHRAELKRAGITHRAPWHRGALLVAKWLF